jgi:hypothetical protein
MDLNQPPLVDNSLVLVPVEDPLPLAIIPPKQPTSTRPQSYGQSYFAHVRVPTLPSLSEHLLLKDAPPKGPIIKVPDHVKLLPLKANEVLTRVKMDKLGQVICAKYSTRPSFEGIHANLAKVKFSPPKEAPKRPAPAPFLREEKCPRTSMVVLETRLDHLTQTVTSIQAQNTLIIRTMDTMSKKIESDSAEIKHLKREQKS